MIKGNQIILVCLFTLGVLLTGNPFVQNYLHAEENSTYYVKGDGANVRNWLTEDLLMKNPIGWLKFGARVSVQKTKRGGIFGRRGSAKRKYEWGYIGKNEKQQEMWVAMGLLRQTDPFKVGPAVYEPDKWCKSLWNETNESSSSSFVGAEDEGKPVGLDELDVKFTQLDLQFISLQKRALTALSEPISIELDENTGKCTNKRVAQLVRVKKINHTIMSMSIFDDLNSLVNGIKGNVEFYRKIACGRGEDGKIDKNVYDILVLKTRNMDTKLLVVSSFIASVNSYLEVARTDNKKIKNRLAYCSLF